MTFQCFQEGVAGSFSTVSVARSKEEPLIINRKLKEPLIINRKLNSLPVRELQVTWTVFLKTQTPALTPLHTLGLCDPWREQSCCAGDLTVLCSCSLVRRQSGAKILWLGFTLAHLYLCLDTFNPQAHRSANCAGGSGE